MSKIKTRETHKDIKALDKVAVAGERMRDAFIRTKDHAQNLTDDGQVSPSEYAEDQMQYAAEDLTREAGHATSSGVNTAVQQSKKAYQRHKKKKTEQVSADEPKTTTPDFPQGNPIDLTAEQELSPQEKGRAKAKADAVKKKASARTASRGTPYASGATTVDMPAYSDLPAYHQGKVHARQSMETARETTHKTIKTAKQAEKTVNFLKNSCNLNVCWLFSECTTNPNAAIHR